MSLNLESKISLNSAEFEHGLDHAGESLKEFVVKAVGVATIGEAFEHTAETVSEFAATVIHGSERLNITTDAFQKFAYAAARSDTDVGYFEGALDRLARAQTEAKEKTGAARSSLYAFGLTLDEIKDSTPEQLFAKIAESISTTGTSAEKTAQLIKLFGRGAGALIPMMKELTEQNEKGGIGQAIVTEKDLATIENATKASKGFYENLKRGLTTVSAGALRAVANPIDTLSGLFQPGVKDRSEQITQTRNLEDKLAAQKAAAAYVANGNSDKVKDFRVPEKTETETKDHEAALEIEKQITAEMQRQRMVGMSDGQKRVELAKQIKELEHDVKGAPFEGLSEKETAEKKLKLQQTVTEVKQLDAKNPLKIKPREDSLIKTGNFLGSSKMVINSAQSALAEHAAQTVTHTRKTADNTKAVVEVLGKILIALPAGFTKSAASDITWPSN